MPLPSICLFPAPPPLNSPPPPPCHDQPPPPPLHRQILLSYEWSAVWWVVQVHRERRLRKVSEQAAQAAADSLDAERHRQAARAAQEAAVLHLKVVPPATGNVSSVNSYAAPQWLHNLMKIVLVCVTVWQQASLVQHALRLNLIEGIVCLANWQLTVLLIVACMT